MEARADVAAAKRNKPPAPLALGADFLETLFHWNVLRRRRSLHQRRARNERLPRHRLTLAGQVWNFVIKIDLHEINRTGWTGLLRGWIATRCSLSRGLVCNGRRATRKKPRTGVVAFGSYHPFILLSEFEVERRLHANSRCEVYNGLPRYAVFVSSHTERDLRRR